MPFTLATFSFQPDAHWYEAIHVTQGHCLMRHSNLQALPTVIKEFTKRSEGAQATSALRPTLPTMCAQMHAHTCRSINPAP